VVISLAAAAVELTLVALPEQAEVVAVLLAAILIKLDSLALQTRVAAAAAVETQAVVVLVVRVLSLFAI
jgi:hypothetical protein